MVGYTSFLKRLLCLVLLFWLVLGAPTPPEQTPTALEPLKPMTPSKISKLWNKFTGKKKVPDSTLYTLWKEIPATKMAKGIDAKGHTWDHSKTDAWGITYLHGCTGILVSDPDFVVVGHLLQDDGKTCILSNTAEVEIFVEGKLLDAIMAAKGGKKNSLETQVTVVYDNKQVGINGGLEVIKNFFNDHLGVNGANYVPIGYSGSSGVGEPSSKSPLGLGAVQWVPKNKGPNGNIKVFWGSDTPLRNDFCSKNSEGEWTCKAESHS